MDMWLELSWKKNGLDDNRVGSVKINNITVNVVEHLSDFPEEAPTYELKAISPSGKNVTNMFIDELYLLEGSAYLLEDEVNDVLEAVNGIYN